MQRDLGTRTFVIEDERHAEPQGEFKSFGEAVAELRRRATIPWNEAPNQAPCTSWETCGRSYEIIEYDCASRPWKELNRVSALEVSAEGVKLNPAVAGERRDA
jgi:hypothetical protein